MNQKKLFYFLIPIGIFFGLITLIFSTLNSHQSTKKNNLPQNINTTITKSSDPEYDLMNQNDNFNSYFPENLTNTDSQIKFQKDDASVTFSLINSTKKASAKNDKNQVTYSKIFQTGTNYIDLRYTISPDSLSEEFILNKKQTVPQLKQKLQLFNVYAVQIGNQINFYKPLTNEVLWFIPAPVMYEQDDPQIQNHGITYSLECENPTTLLQDCRTIILTKTITPDGQAWLNDPKRNYPVIIDPNFQLNNANTYTQWISSNTAALAVSQETTIKIEGTGSVKIIGTTGPDSCWGLSGNCDSGCANTAIGTSATVYSTCTQGSLCSNTNCWSTDGGSTCDAGCTNSSSSTTTAYTTCTASTCSNTNCWTYAGTCNANCNVSSIGSTTVYSTCTPSLCDNTGCWAYSGTCNTGCNKGSYSSFTAYSSYTYCGAQVNGITCYTFSGTCSDTGSGSCYRPSCAIYHSGYYRASTCATVNCYGARCTCSWIDPQYSYTASGAYTAYTGSGTCASGSGNCYIVNNSASRYTGDTACGGSNCTTGTYYGSYNTCTWVPTQNSYTASGAYTAYTGSGTCSSSGTGSCYKHTSSSTVYTGDTACGGSNCTTGTYYTGRTTCSWITPKYPYTASSTTVRYSGNGTACNSSGTGSCYKMIPDGTNTYTGNTACGGGSTCAGASVRYTYSPCTFYSGSVNQTVTTQLTPTDLSNADVITFWVRSSRTGSYLRFQIGESSSAEQTFDFSINQANTWEQKTFDISGIATASRNAIQFMAIKVTDMSSNFTLYLDDIETNILISSPQNCRISQNDDNSIFTLNWTDASSDENGFLLYKQTDSSGFSLLDGAIAADTTSYIDSPIAQNHTYSYKLFSYLTTAGTQVTSVACDFPSITISDQGSLKFDNIKLEGVKIN